MEVIKKKIQLKISKIKPPIGQETNGHAGFYLRKKVAGSTLKIEGSIFGAEPRMRGPKARAGGEPERGVSPLFWQQYSRV